MAVINFPDSPSDGATQTVGGITYTYSSSKGYWTAAASSGGGGGGGASVTTDDTAPSSPSDGDLWWDSAGGKMYVYYQDADSSQWVSVSVPGSTGPAGATGADATPTSYTNFAAFPSTGNTLGDFAIAQDTKALYVWDGSEWDRIASGSDESPIITTEPPTAAQELNSSGATSTVTMVAEDPEGFDIEYGIKYNTTGGALPSQLASATTIDQNTGVYTFTPSTNSANEGSFKARLTASDGNRVTTRTVDFSLGFFPTSGLLGYYDFGDSNSYSGSGTTLSDLSGNNNHQTISGSTGTYLSDDGGTFKFEYGTNMNFESGGISKSAVKEIMVFAMLKVGAGGDWNNSFGNLWCPFGLHSGVAVWYMNSGGTSTTLDRGNMTAHSGETAFYAVNGNTVSTQGDGWAPFAANPTKFSSLTVSGYSMNLTNALVYNNYAIDWKGRHYVKMFAFWNRTLSAAERQQAHNYYAGLIGTNAVAWQA